jgi:hypothetical protein
MPPEGKITDSTKRSMLERASVSVSSEVNTKYFKNNKSSTTPVEGLSAGSNSPLKPITSPC